MSPVANCDPCPVTRALGTHRSVLRQYKVLTLAPKGSYTHQLQSRSQSLHTSTPINWRMGSTLLAPLDGATPQLTRGQQSELLHGKSMGGVGGKSAEKGHTPGPLSPGCGVYRPQSLCLVKVRAHNQTLFYKTSPKVKDEDLESIL